MDENAADHRRLFTAPEGQVADGAAVLFFQPFDVAGDAEVHSPDRDHHHFIFQKFGAVVTEFHWSLQFGVASTDALVQLHGDVPVRPTCTTVDTVGLLPVLLYEVALRANDLRQRTIHNTNLLFTKNYGTHRVPHSAPTNVGAE